MKRIIYTAVALIICASVFGIADYYSAKKQGALVNYTDEAETSEVVAEKKTGTTVALKEARPVSTSIEIKKNTRASKKPAKAKVKDSRYTGIPEVVVTEKTIEPVSEKMDPVTTILQSKTTDGNDSTLKEEKRTIKMEMFSRAPIRTKKIAKK